MPLPLVIIMLLGYALIAFVFAKDFRKGLKVHKANLSHFKFNVVPRFTVRLSNGRFKANKVGIFYVATH